MSNDKFINGGPGLVGDLARMGGDPAGVMSNEDLGNNGPGFWADKARFGGTVIADPLTISGEPTTQAVEGESYNGFTVSSDGGVEPRRYSFVGDWPSGLSINSSTGAVYGTPTEAGEFTGLSVRVTDDNDTTAQLSTFTLDVAEGD